MSDFISECPVDIVSNLANNFLFFVSAPNDLTGLVIGVCSPEATPDDEHWVVLCTSELRWILAKFRSRIQLNKFDIKSMKHLNF